MTSEDIKHQLIIIIERSGPRSVSDLWRFLSVETLWSVWCLRFCHWRQNGRLGVEGAGAEEPVRFQRNPSSCFLNWLFYCLSAVKWTMSPLHRMPLVWLLHPSLAGFQRLYLWHKDLIDFTFRFLIFRKKCLGGRRVWMTRRPIAVRFSENCVTIHPSQPFFSSSFSQRNMTIEGIKIWLLNGILRSVIWRRKKIKNKKKWKNEKRRCKKIWMPSSSALWFSEKCDNCGKIWLLSCIHGSLI